MNPYSFTAGANRGAPLKAGATDEGFSWAIQRAVKEPKTTVCTKPENKLK